MTNGISPNPGDESPLPNSAIRSPIVSWLANLPPVAWITQRLTRQAVASHLHQQTQTTTVTASPPPPPLQLSAAAELGSVFESIAQDAVHALNFAGAMVAVYERGDRLAIRAFHIDPSLLLQHNELGDWVIEIEHAIRVAADDNRPTLYLYDPTNQDNASVQAYHSGLPSIRSDLHSLFVGLLPDNYANRLQAVQAALGVKQVVSVPFFIRTTTASQPLDEIVGMVIAASTHPFDDRDLAVLTAFGRQAAGAIESERRRQQTQLTQAVVLRIQASLEDEQSVLQQIAEGVVRDLGYAGAMVATYESDGALPVRAFALETSIATPQQVSEWEKAISRVAGEEISMSDPLVARTYVNRPEYHDNLSVKAVRRGMPVTSDALFDLFTPIAPNAARPVVKAIQDELGIQQVIAVPFFHTKMVNGRPQREIVGNLFAATRSRTFSAGELDTLNIFGLQAAVGLYNARLYKRSEERRRVAQGFGKMAFSAAAYVHDLRNHIGAFHSYLHVIQMLYDSANGDFTIFGGMLQKMPDYMRRLDRAKEILDNLHEPWKEISDEPVEINQCILRAIDTVMLSHDKPTAEGVRILVPQNDLLSPVEYELDRPPNRIVTLDYELADDLPTILTATDMLTETFRILIKNALEAIVEHQQGAKVTIRSHMQNDQTIEVTVRDDGIGIRPEHLQRVFELGWTTKKKGMGFGLFWSRDYIEGLGGELHVKSAFRRGTTFTIILPVPDQTTGRGR